MRGAALQEPPACLRLPALARWRLWAAVSSCAEGAATRQQPPAARLRVAERLFLSRVLTPLPRQSLSRSDAACRRPAAACYQAVLLPRSGHGRLLAATEPQQHAPVLVAARSCADAFCDSAALQLHRRLRAAALRLAVCDPDLVQDVRHQGVACQECRSGCAALCCSAALSPSTFTSDAAAAALTDCPPVGLNLLPRTIRQVASLNRPPASAAAEPPLLGRLACAGFDLVLPIG